MKSSKAKPALVPRRRNGRIVPIHPMDYEPKQMPYTPTKVAVGDVRAAITLMGALAILLFLFWLVEYLVEL